MTSQHFLFQIIDIVFYEILFLPFILLFFNFIIKWILWTFFSLETSRTPSYLQKNSFVHNNNINNLFFSIYQKYFMNFSPFKA